MSIPPRAQPAAMFCALTALVLGSCRTDGSPKSDTAGLGGDSGLQDRDGDGYPGSEDCNDADPATHPEAVEICDGIDNDCDGAVDEEVTDTWYADADGDGFGDEAEAVEACSVPAGWVHNGVDCDDADATVYPGAPDACDGLDNDCDGDVDEDGTTTWYADADADGYGDDAVVVEDCARPEGFVERGGDCDDAHAGRHPDLAEVCDEVDNDCDGDVDEGVTRTFYRDGDGDGWGVAADTREACAPTGVYVEDAGDCDDFDTRYHPGAPESDCADPNDYNCDGSVSYADADGDGWAACEECDDGDPAVNPDAPEVCNGVDDDCDGDTDDDDGGVDLSTGSTWYGDADGDGYGDASDPYTACAQPSGTVADATDCDDGAVGVHPGASEVCNLIDDDCDGAIDDDDSGVDLSTGTTFYADSDGDGFGDGSASLAACAQPAGYGTDATDCDDSAPAVNPGATEVCNGIDDDCDGDIDDDDSSVDLSTGTTWYADADADGYGTEDSVVESCAQPSGYLADATDCDDADAAVNPGETEICNGIDDDCDNAVDDDDSDLDVSTGSTFYADTDADGFGDSGATVAACLVPSGYVADDSDCDDARAAVNPAATEVCNSLDDDCDGATDDADTSLDTSTATTWYTDADSDGYGAATGTLACVQPSGTSTSASDCDDGDSAVHPGATETCDGADNDCDGTIDEGFSAVSTSITTASPTSSCNGNANRSVTFTACGCAPVTLTGSFHDNSDGSSGQVVGVSTSSSSMTLTWDDAPSGGDCDLDIRSAISWTASYSAGTMSITVTDSITGYSAGNSLVAGYTISDYGTTRRGSGSGTRTYTYSCY